MILELIQWIIWPFKITFLWWIWLLCLGLIIRVISRVFPKGYYIWKKIIKLDVEWLDINKVLKDANYQKTISKLKSSLKEQYVDLLHSKLGNDIVLPLKLYNTNTNMHLKITSENILKEVIKNKSILILWKP